MMMAGIGDNGVYADWSPYFDYSTDNGFELSKKLPLPTKRVLREDASGVDISEYVNLLDYQKNKQYYLFLSRLAEVLEATKDGIFKFDESVPEKDRLALVRIINKHNTYWHDASTAIKNKIFDTMYNISSNPRNYVAETTILDISIARDAARESPMSKENSSNSNNNPAAMMIAQEQALVGKNTIGAFANGIKTFSACVVHYKTGIERANAAYNQLLQRAREYAVSLGLTNSEDPIAVAFEYLEQKMGELTDEERVAIDNAIITEDLSNISNHYQREYVSAKILEKNSNIDKFRIKVNSKSELDVTINGKDKKLKFAHTLPNIDLLNTETQYPALLDLIEDTRSEGAQQNVQDMLGILLNCATD